MLLMGCSKKLYNVLGVTSIIIHITEIKCSQKNILFNFFFVYFHNALNGDSQFLYILFIIAYVNCAFLPIKSFIPII